MAKFNLKDQLAGIAALIAAIKAAMPANWSFNLNFPIF